MKLELGKRLSHNQSHDGPQKMVMGLPLDARTQVPLREIGDILKEQQDAELRSPEGPHDVLSLALPQPVPNKDMKATRREGPGPTAKQGPPPYETKLETPPAHVIQQGRQDAITTVRRTVASPRIPAVSDSNPLGLPWDADGQPAKPRLVTIQGDEMQERHVRYNTFCTFLVNREEYVQAFNSLPQQHQIAVLLLQEEWEDRPHLVKERFLWAPIPQ